MFGMKYNFDHRCFIIDVGIKTIMRLITPQKNKKLKDERKSAML